MNDLEKLAWQIYCECTWTGVAKDFWEELNVHEKSWALAAARAAQRGVLKMKDASSNIDQEYWT